MVLRRLLQSALNNARLIEKLSESTPVRRAAQITVYVIARLQVRGRSVAERLSQSNALRQLLEKGDIPRNLEELNKKVAELKDAIAKELKESIKDSLKKKDKK
ncbi:protein NCBP2AS2 [Stegostoma tigrinum]|uniref:protein NCBP2AS2 n=1 Tax=Stegostoma tigrinum TaxID=3053191 RepID=UPI00202AF863|nr:protein NCBP2AS2 [Stegostoma tigrinum]